MRENGIEAAVKKVNALFSVYVAVIKCLVKKVTDTDGVENGGSVRGMGLLPMETEFKTERQNESKRCF